MEICNHDLCTGCFACKSICPKGAIEKKTDRLGRTVPVVNEELCVNCGLCEKACPTVTPPTFRESKVCYAAWSKLEEDRNTCASGGISTGIGRYVIEQGGVVFGTYFKPNDNLVLEFGMASSVEELERFKTSKYVQADTADSYEKAKEQLDNGKLVLYVGSPCQIAGLYGFLRKDYENLLTVDIICHGVPPIEYLRDYQKSVCKGKIAEYATFRGKDDFSMQFYSATNELLFKKEAKKDFYFKAFLDGLIYRENCYSCVYAQRNRVADFTIGDFWELDKSTLKEDYNGKVSVILINSEKASNYIENIKELFYLEKRSIEEAVRGNTQLREPAKAHDGRLGFLNTYPKKGVVVAIRKSGISKEIIIYGVKTFIKRVRRYIKKS